MAMIDTAHLSLSPSFQPFTFSSASLARLVESSAYTLIGKRVLFGIRGASLMAGEYGQFSSEVTLVESTLDGENLRCLMGIWDLTNGKIALFPASTIPHQYWQQKQIDSPKEAIANCLGMGAYDYRIGAHEPHNRPFEEGAFRLTRLQPVFAWRFYQANHQYALVNGKGTLGIVNDNIHSAQTNSQPQGLSFASAGCQVIEGDHCPPEMPSGYYQQFRILSGQSAMPSPLEVGQSYRYLLTSARKLESIVAGDSAPELLQGSTGYAVRLLQEYLLKEGLLDEELIDKGYFNGHTAYALYQLQQAKGVLADGIMTTKLWHMLKLPEAYFS